MDHLIDLGRPRMIHLAVMIDARRPELPIAATTSAADRLKAGGNVEVKLKAVDRTRKYWCGVSKAYSHGRHVTV